MNALPFAVDDIADPNGPVTVIRERGDAVRVPVEICSQFR
jgi:hypothetical protein